VKRIDLQEKLQFFDWEVKSKTGGIKKARLQGRAFLITFPAAQVSREPLCFRLTTCNYLAVLVAGAVGATGAV
jgi:hypothetical protein